jgi:hypothetical protein
MAIARGLAVTGRAAPAILVGNWLKARARRGDRRENYYIPISDGAMLLRGLMPDLATELSPKFAATMEIIGKRGMG